MATSKTIASYGGPYLDRKTVSDPSSQMAARKGNRLLEDAAQMTRTNARARVAFQLATSGSSIDPANVTHCTMWGSGSTEKPTVARTGTGEYTITWPATLPDGVGDPDVDGIGDDEAVVFTFEEGAPNVRGSTDGRARIATIVSNVVTIKVYDTTNALSDLGGSATVVGFGVR